MQLISMSLYGDLDMYITGARENVATYKKYYPDWSLRIYCSEPIDLDCETVIMGQSLEHSGMFWRFLPIWECERVIVRDTDSRFSCREAAAVEEWVASGMRCHSMHDHEHHRCYPLFGGMFGIFGKMPDLLNNLRHAISLPQKRVADMNWLRDYLWPELEHDTLHHSSVPLQWPSRPFTVSDEGFVGQQHAW